MIIYHGSKLTIKNPIPHGSDPHNDYGPSFYMTTSLEGAKIWACKQNSLGVVNEYEIRKSDYDNLKILDLTDKTKYSPLHWIAILMHFRVLPSNFKENYKTLLDWIAQYYIDVDDYDIVIGYRADDAYFRFPISFIQNRLSYEDLERIYQLGDLGIQYAFMSEKAIKSLRFVRTIECEENFIGKYFEIVQESTSQFQKTLDLPVNPDKTYLINMVQNKK